ncbi:uncharacterized protein [Eleutherodactylus coqui]|uniref:uncharacterized protein n=1 Tax=Eleutherodactylus coqui TaxID=57060 RepID=UPI003462A49B
MQNPTTGDRRLGPPQTTAGKMQSSTTGDRSLGPPQTTAGNMKSKNRNASSQAASHLSMGSKFTCRDCGFTCNSFYNFRIHVQTANCKGGEKAQKTSTINAGAEPDNGEDNATKLKDFISIAEREPLIGMEYVTEYRLKTKNNLLQIQYYCELCDCSTDIESTMLHLAGANHQKRYLAKEYPYVISAQAKSKEELSKFIKRMAVEIEREEGTKLYKSDPEVRMEIMTTVNKGEEQKNTGVF